MLMAFYISMPFTTNTLLGILTLRRCPNQTLELVSCCISPDEALSLYRSNPVPVPWYDAQRRPHIPSVLLLPKLLETPRHIHINGQGEASSPFCVVLWKACVAKGPSELDHVGQGLFCPLVRHLPDAPVLHECLWQTEKGYSSMDPQLDQGCSKVTGTIQGQDWFSLITCWPGEKSELWRLFVSI